MSIFISWAGDDREVKNVILEKLREKDICGQKINVYDSDEFCESDFSRECIEKIRMSSVFIVIVSEASMSPKSYVFNEVIEARRLEGEGRLNILVYKITDAPYTERFAFNLNHISDANHISRMGKVGGVSGIDTLVNRAYSLLERRLNGTPEKPYDVNIPKIAGTRISQSKYFVDGSRDNILSQMENAFSRSNTVILSEIFGFGKKSIVKKYINNHPEISAVEIQARNNTLSRVFLSDLHFSNVNESAFLGEDDEKIIDKKFEFLKKLQKTDMIVISDLDLDGGVDERLCARLSELDCRVVIITQDSGDEYADAFPVIFVGKMENSHLLELFFHYYKCAEDEKELLLPHLCNFFADIGGHTQTIELTASVLYKDMRATPDEVISRLSFGSDGNSEMKGRILGKLSELLSLENFSDDEKKTLFLISLLANPTIDEKKLRELLRECGIFDFSAISRLDDHRWINYDTNSKTVYIEPIIAKICANEFLPICHGVCHVCLDYFNALFLRKDYAVSSFRQQVEIVSQLQNVFLLLDFGTMFALAKEFSNVAIYGIKDYEKISSVCQAYIERYGELLLREEEEFEDLESCFARWAYAYLYVAMKTIEKAPMLYGFSGGDLKDLRNLIMDEDVYEELSEYIGDENFSKVVESLGKDGDCDDVESLCIIHCMTVIYAFYKKDFRTVQKKSEEFWDFLQENPEALNGEEVIAYIILLVKTLHTFYSNTRAYRMGMAFYERILPIEWNYDVRYRLLLMYCDFLFSVDGEEDFALCVIQSAEEIFEDAMEKRNERERREALSELNLYYAFAFAYAKDVDSAIEKYNEVKAAGVDISSNDFVILLNLICDRLLACDTERAHIFIEENAHLIRKYKETESTSEELRGKLESLLFLLEMENNEGAFSFSAGGIMTDESYYEKYSKEKKNSLSLLMSYKRTLDRVKKYDFSALSNKEIAEHSKELFRRASEGESKANIIPEAFALVSEAGYRVLGYRHHHVQYIGAAVMLDGKIAEILNGEGKTYTITLVAYVNSLYSKKTVVVDESLYLAKRNYSWMKGVYDLLGVSAESTFSSDDRTHFSCESDAKIIYADMKTFAFSILKNEIDCKEKPFDLSQFSVIVDEADTVLIECAKKHLHVVGNKNASAKNAEKCQKAYKIAHRIKNDTSYYSKNKYGAILLTREVRPLIEDEFCVDYENFEHADRIVDIEGIVCRALYNIATLKRDKDYFIRAGRIYKEDVDTGHLCEVDCETGLFLALANNLNADNYLVGLKNKPSIVNCTYVYGVFSSIGKLCGTSATVSSFKKEFKEIYALDVVAVPTVLPVRRVDSTVSLYVSKSVKKRDIVNLITEKHEKGQPVLLIVENIEESREFSSVFNRLGIVHSVLNGLNEEKSPEIFANAGKFGSVVIATQLANRGVDIKLGGDAQRMTIFDLVENGVDISGIDKILYRIPTAEEKETPLYIAYTSTFERNKAIVAQDKKKVTDAGGLCVISTTTYADMRVEQQIRGRAGRQGDVGESYVYISAEDDLLADTLAPLKNSKFFKGNIVGQCEIFDLASLRKSIENFKQAVHHRTFAKMKGASLLCKRIEKSKRELLGLKNGIQDGTLTLEDIAGMWARNEDNIASAIEIANRNREKAKPSVRFLHELYYEKFMGITPKNAKEKLKEIAVLYIGDSTISEEMKKDLLGYTVLDSLSDHLTSMNDMTVAYNSSDAKNSNKFFDDMYSQDLERQISSCVDTWFEKLLKVDAKFKN